MPTYAELHAEYKLLFPACIDRCFCEHCNINGCLFCYLDLGFLPVVGVAGLLAMMLL